MGQGGLLISHQLSATELCRKIMTKIQGALMFWIREHLITFNFLPVSPTSNNYVGPRSLPPPDLIMRQSGGCGKQEDENEANPPLLRSMIEIPVKSKKRTYLFGTSPGTLLLYCLWYRIKFFGAITFIR